MAEEMTLPDVGTTTTVQNGVSVHRGSYCHRACQKQEGEYKRTLLC